jgi:hypothetical protein
VEVMVGIRHVRTKTALAWNVGPATLGVEVLPRASVLACRRAASKLKTISVFHIAKR